MAHYAILNPDNYVCQVIVGKDENEIVLDENGQPIDWEMYYGGKRTSYNTRNGVHKLGGIPFRKNFAGPGFYYDENRDAFIPPKPYPSWIFDEDKCNWNPPVNVPDDSDIVPYYWDEFTLNWKKITSTKSL